ncbi:hypothetical protein D3C80_1347410 [compost metagenome]
MQQCDDSTDGKSFFKTDADIDQNTETGQCHCQTGLLGEFPGNIRVHGILLQAGCAAEPGSQRISYDGGVAAIGRKRFIKAQRNPVCGLTADGNNSRLKSGFADDALGLLLGDALRQLDIQRRACTEIHAVVHLLNQQAGNPNNRQCSRKDVEPLP